MAYLQEPPKRQFRLGFSMWSVPLLAQTDHYEVIVVGLVVGQNGAISYQALMVGRCQLKANAGAPAGGAASRIAADLHALSGRYLKASAFDLTEEEFSRIIHATASVDVTVASEVCDGLQALSTAEEPVFSAGFDSILKADGDAGEPSWIGAGYLVLQAAMYGMEPDKNGAAPSLRVLLPLLHEAATRSSTRSKTTGPHHLFEGRRKLLTDVPGVNDSSLWQTTAAIQRQEAAENRLPLIIPSLDHSQKASCWMAPNGSLTA